MAIVDDLVVDGHLLTIQHDRGDLVTAVVEEELLWTFSLKVNVHVTSVALAFC